MNNTTQQTTFWKFLSEHTIEIPIIQRDYAQGRKDKISLRKGFLGDLKKALDRNLPNGEKNLKLDFVYGSTENGKLQPLDGQQRLTTLWLLHWYIALRAGKLADAAHVLSKFTYETRISSREFCKQLCMPDNFQTLNPLDKIVPYITNQTWFFSAWKQDPTIQAMLTMLSGTSDKAKNGEEIIDGLEEAFTKKFDAYWQILISEDCPIIFYYLDLLGLKLSDDLYIKMNARGKQLTSFENFKADLIGYIEQQARDNKDWEIFLDPQNGLPIKLDTVWMDIFWKNKSEDFKVDDIYFAFLNRFFLNYYIVDSSKTAEEIESDGIFNYFYGEKSNDTQIQYTSFSKYKQLDLQVIEALKRVLDNYHSVLESYHRPLNDKGLLKLEDLFPVWVDKNLVFIPKYANDSITTLTQPQRVVFYAICRYFEKCESNYNEIQFKQWMRVVWNIVENANVNTISTMIGCMRLVKELSEGCLDIYDFLSSSKIKSEAVKEQVREEIEKVKKIVDDRWEDKIIQAESYAFFKGAIRFLFRDENGNVKWNDFDTKWENAQKLIPECEGKRHTIKELTPYLDENCIKKIYFHWVSNKDEDLRTIMLDKNGTECFHHFLLQDDKKYESLVHSNIISLCESQFKGRAYLRTNWDDAEYIWTNRETRHGYYDSDCFVIGDELYSKIAINLKNWACCQDCFVDSLYKGLHIIFEYNRNYFMLSPDKSIYLCDKDKKKEKKNDKYICFRIEDRFQDICDKLDELISQAVSPSTTTPVQSE